MRHKQALAVLYTIQCLLHPFTEAVRDSQFELDGDYLIGGLFDIHHASGPVYHGKPETIACSAQQMTLSSYRRFQLMRFSVEEINRSTKLLPNVTLGYKLYDHCSDLQNFPGILEQISVNDVIQLWASSAENFPKVIAVVGTYTSTETLTVAPLFMTNLIPMVSYGAASSVLSRKQKFPSFLRTVHPNKDVILVLFNILQYFNWHWVSFLYSEGDYGKDGLDLFTEKLKDTEICLAYTKGLNEETDYPQMFRQIEAQRVNIIIVFAPEWHAETLIKSAIEQNITNKVWIAGDAWSLHKELPKETGIRNIGTVLGVAEPAMTIPGFSDFIHASTNQSHRENADQEFCKQICNCSSVSAADIVNTDPSFNFPVYSAVYAIAHALHSTLECDGGECKRHIQAQPHIVLSALRNSDFTLLNQTVQFDANGDPRSGSYSVVFWNSSGDAEVVGFHNFHPSNSFFINNTRIRWHGGGKVPLSYCSKECPVGYSKKQEGIYKCCFSCKICSIGTYINSTKDPYNCYTCEETEWSPEGSTACKLRLVEFIPFTDIGAILITTGTCILVCLTLGMSVLFAINYKTPVVRSAGGPMCFLILGCLSLCCLSVLSYFDKPTLASCILRLLPFLLFFTVCLACFVVRSFQIICIFKIAAKFPKLLSLWTKCHGQWSVIGASLFTQAVFLSIGCSLAPPKPYSDVLTNPEKIILGCDFSLKALVSPAAFLLSLSCLCFIFSYMGKDLPKNYNEAKAITFCLLLLILTWIVLVTTSMLYSGKHIHTFTALAVLSSLYSFLLWYFLPKCYIIIFQPHKNTLEHFQGLIQNYTKTANQ